jgi:predicted TIM-barrel fold metal-dependent hydrolase
MFHATPVIEHAGPPGRPQASSLFYQHHNPLGVFITHPHFAPLWSRIEELGLVAAVHPSLGTTNPEPSSAGSHIERVAERLQIGHTVAEPVAYQQDNGIFLTAACFQGLMEDHPRLRFALLHSGASWLPLALEKAETYLWVAIPSVFAAPEDPVTLEPEEVWDEAATAVSFDAWEEAVARQPDVFAAKAAWGSRYPHHDACAPSEAAELLTAYGVAGTDQERMMGGNAAELFRLPAPTRVLEGSPR